MPNSEPACEIALEEDLPAKPRLLDLFCGAGGCTKGYQRAGFHVTGIDIAPQPRYIDDHFIQADVIAYMEELLSVGPPRLQFDAIHASPPCHDYSRAMRHLSSPTPRRHRIFESSFQIAPPVSSCRCSSTLVLNPHRAESRERIYAEFGSQDPEILWRNEMGVEWMGRYETREAIPPAYTEFIGFKLFQYLLATEVAA